MVNILELLRSIVAVRRVVSRQKRAGESWAAAYATANALETQILVRGSASVEPLAAALLDDDRDLTWLAATLLFRLDAERARTAAEAAILAGRFFSDVTAYADAPQLAKAMRDHGSAALLERLRVDKGVQYHLGLLPVGERRSWGSARPEFCKTLGQDGGHGAFETLAQAALNDPEVDVRIAAVRALGALGDPRGAEVVARGTETYYLAQDARQEVLLFFREQAARGPAYAAVARMRRELEEWKTWLEDREFPNWDILKDKERELLDKERAKVAASGDTLAAPTPEVTMGAFLYDLAMSLDNQGKIQSELGQHEAAVASAEEALETIWPLFLDQPAALERDTAVIIGRVLKCLEALGRPASPELLARIETFNAKRDG